MAGFRFVLLAILIAPSLALAQGFHTSTPTTSTEDITVNGLRNVQGAVIDKFVGAITSPARAGKIARWKAGVCPKTTGLAPKFAAYITWRVRDIARQIGAPVADASDCKPNIHIMFMDQPQALLDGVRKKSPAYLGYYDNEAQADTLAKITRPIQSWYVTQTEDAHGALHFDSHTNTGMVEIVLPCIFPPCTDSDTIKLPSAQAYATTGTRLGDGLSSVFYHVLVVADPAKLRDNEIGAMADIIAMLALAEIDKPDVCGALPSILNLLTPDCAQKPGAMTQGDAAFLRGLYKITTTTTVGGQREEIAYQMRHALGAKKD
jgi:hypothetical protein